MYRLRVAVYHRGDAYRYQRIDGQFAYPCDGLEWKQFKLAQEPTDLHALKTCYDVAWLDEGKYKGRRLFSPAPDKGRPLPVVYWALYPTLAEHIYTSRVALARQDADAVLVDHDDLARWARDTGLPVRRLAYATNERYYRDRGLIRDVDVGFYCVYAYNAERPALDDWLAGFCKRKGWSYGTTKGENVGTRYAELLARTKVVVHLNRTPKTRPPRIFDTAAAGTALCSNPLPAVSGEHFEPWVHYVPFDEPASLLYQQGESCKPFDDTDCEELAHCLEWLVDEGHWEHVAHRARAYVLACHTWRQRAVELRGILCDLFPALRERAGEGWVYEH